MSQLFDLYTNAREYDNEFPDQFGRARLYNADNRNIFDPAVSNRIYSSGLTPYYPGNRQFAVCVSHDIDHLFLHQKPARRLVNAGKGFLKGRFGQAFDQLGSLAKEKVYRDYDLKNLVDINDEYGVRPTYYFLSLEKADQDFNYSLASIPEQVDAVIQSGGEIGLHGGHKAYNNYGKLTQEKELLEKSIGRSVYGYRNHYLRFELPVTWSYLEKAGFTYDTTLGYADCIGFRNGMCYPFHPYDVKGRQFLNIVELPLIIMDASLFFYMRMDMNTAFKACKQVIEKVMNCNGVLTLLWHNNFVTGEMGTFYTKILDFLRSTDPWFANSAEVIEWWRKEGFLQRSQGIIRGFLEDNV